MIKYSTLIRRNMIITDKKEARCSVYANITDAMKNLIHAVEDLDINFVLGEDKEKFEQSKSVVFKYMDLMHAKTQPVPKRNCVSVGDRNDDRMKIPCSPLPNATSSENLAESSDNSCPCPATISALKYLWCSPTIQKAYDRRHEFQLTESSAYFLNDLDRVCVHDYEPTDEDILRTRTKTLGIVKIEFAFRHLTVSKMAN